MAKIDLLNKEIRYTQMPIINFLFLSMQNQENNLFLYGLIISIVLNVLLKVSKIHHCRVAKETGRTSFKEMAEDMKKEPMNIITATSLYILFLYSFFKIGVTEWIYPYTQIIITFNLIALVFQIATCYYERETLIEVFVKPMLEKRDLKK